MNNSKLAGAVREYFKLQESVRWLQENCRWARRHKQKARVCALRTAIGFLTIERITARQAIRKRVGGFEADYHE